MSVYVTTLTIVHVAISLVAIAAGFVVLAGLFRAKRLDRWTALFLATTTATNLTGFLFPVDQFLPSHAVGIVSLLVLPVTFVARYRRRLVGRWRITYVVTAVTVLYLNVFVLIVQAFVKVPPLKALAPTQSEAPFALTQGVVLVAFVGLTVGAALRFRKESAGPGRLSVEAV